MALVLVKSFDAGAGAGHEEPLRSFIAALMRIMQRGFMRRRLQFNRAMGV